MLRYGMENTKTLPLSVFHVGYGPHPTAGKVRPLLLMMMMTAGTGVIQHVIRNSGLVDVDESRCRNLTVYLHHCYAADRWLHRLCTYTQVLDPSNCTTSSSSSSSNIRIYVNG